MLQYTACLLAYFLVVVSVSTASRHDARCMEDGDACTVDDLNNEVNEMDSNVYQVMSWNIEGERINDVCRTLSQLPDLMVINFQRVTFDQYQRLHKTCLQEYNVTGIPIDTSARFNPLFYRDDETLLKEIDSGSSGEWDRKCPFLTWTRLSIQVAKTSGPARRRQRFGRSLSSNLYAILSGQTAYRKTRNPQPRIRYLKKILFVNTDVRPSADLRSNTGHCLRYIYMKVNQRRRFRTILSGNIGSVQTVLHYPRRRSVFKECEPEPASSNDQICISNRGRADTFQYKLVAKIDTDTRHQPSFAAFII